MESMKESQVVAWFKQRLADSCEVVLAPWNTGLGMGVFPLFVKTDGRLIPVGTAFLISEDGVVVTAAHCASEMLKRTPSGRRLLPMFPNHGERARIQGADLCLLHHWQAEGGPTRFAICSIEHMTIPLPSDVMVGHANLPGSIPVLPLGITFCLPAARSDVFTVGYSNFVYPDGGIPVDAVRAGEFNWDNDYRHKLVLTAGHVGPTFTRRFAQGFVDGPSFMTSCRTRPGHSGAPVVGGHGLVCGVHSTGSQQMFGCDGGIVSNLAPMLACTITSTWRPAESVSITLTPTVADLVAHGVIKSDDSMALCPIVKADVASAPRVDFMVHKDNVSNTFEDVHAWSASRKEGMRPMAAEGGSDCSP